MTGTEKVEAVVDRNKRYIWLTHVQPLVTDDLVEEHRRDPFGRHSVHLDMVLAFLRSDPLRSRPQYLLMCVEPDRKWVIGEHSRVRGDPITAPANAESFSSVAAAEHAVFLKRLSDITLEYSLA
jgi:branched-chain amino acid transport system permease protein